MFRVEMKASIVVQDESAPPPGIRLQAEVDDIKTTEDEFGEISLTIPHTVVDSTFSTARKIVFGSAGLNGRSIMIKSDKPITIIQTIPGNPPGFFQQPVRSFFMGTYDKTLAPTEIKFVNAGTDPATVKVIFGSKN